MSVKLNTTIQEKIRADIEKNILSGRWPPGFKVPFEHELEKQYDCSRMTVSKALVELARAGLIQRRRRAGSFVEFPRVHFALIGIPDIEADIVARGAKYGLKLLMQRRRPVPSGKRGERVLAGVKNVLGVCCLHFADGRPFAYEDRLINLDAVPDAADADFNRTSPGTWLTSHIPWTEAEHRIVAVNPSQKCAALLGITRSTACLALERRTWRGNQGITFATQIYPGDRFDLFARFAPSDRTK